MTHDGLPPEAEGFEALGRIAEAARAWVWPLGFAVFLIVMAMV